MKFRTLQHLISALDIIMVVTAVAAVLLKSALLWILTAVICAARIVLYLRSFPCPNCGKTVRPDRSTIRCPHCGNRMDE